MGRERQKKKNRSSTPRVTNTRTVAGGRGGRTKRGKRKVDFSGAGGAGVVREHWDRNLTLLQNYRRLGLTSRLNGATGGVEKRKRHGRDKAANADGDSDLLEEDGDKQYDNNDGAFSIPGMGSKSATKRSSDQLTPSQVRVERDPATGRILRVISEQAEGSEDQAAGGKKNNRWRPDDFQNPDSDSDTTPPTTTTRSVTKHPSDIIAALEAQVEAEAAQIALQRQRRPRYQSQRETEWIERLVDKYGSKGTAGGGGGDDFDFDFAAMARDRKLNPMQQTEMDIRRRIERWRARRRVEGGG